MAVVVNNLYKNFGKYNILKNISLEIHSGEIVGLIGPNGAGKSTLMKCISRLIFPNKGTIHINGKDVVKDPSALEDLSSLIESPGLYPELTGLAHLKLFSDLRKTNKDYLEKVKEITGLGQSLSLKAGRYSMGMKQRLALGIALLGDPEFFILDEPFVGLDPSGIFELRETLARLVAEGKGVLISSHQLLDLEKITTRTIFMNQGSLVGHDAITQEISSFKIIPYHRLTEGERSDIQKMSNRVKFFDEFLIYQGENYELFNDFVAQLIHRDVMIKSIIPIEKDLETLYKQIY